MYLYGLTICLLAFFLINYWKLVCFWEFVENQSGLDLYVTNNIHHFLSSLLVILCLLLKHVLSNST